MSRDSGRRERRRVVPRPERLRSAQGVAYGWADAGLLRRGWLHRLRPEDAAAYLFLCLAADRQGVSFYRRERIARELGLDDRAAFRALGRLRELDLVAYAPFHEGAADGFHQVLSLPASAPPPSEAEELARELADRLGRRGDAR